MLQLNKNIRKLNLRLPIVLLFCLIFSTALAQDTLDATTQKKWNRTYPFEFFSGYNFLQNSLDLSLKIHLINRKSIGYGMRYGRMKSAPMKMCFVAGNEFYMDRAINGMKCGVDFTPFYRVRFSTLARPDEFVFSDFLYYTIGQLYLRANYVYYFDAHQSNHHCFRPEIGISPYFQFAKKRQEKLKEKGIYRTHYFYLHPTISYGFDIDLISQSNFNLNKNHMSLGISLSYEKLAPWNSRP